MPTLANCAAEYMRTSGADRYDASTGELEQYLQQYREAVWVHTKGFGKHIDK